MDEFAWYIYPIVVITGFLAGFVNTLAGSGSLITLSLLVFIGIPETLANATNRVGVVIQSLVSAGTYQQEKVLDTRGGLILSIPATIGAILGSYIASQLGDTDLRFVLGVVMVIMLFVILIKPKRWLEGSEESFQGTPSLMQMTVLFIIGIYGGFIQAGVGVFLLAGLVLSAGYDLVRANAVKVLIVACLTIVSLLVFILNDQVLWGIGLLLAVGNAIGGWLAARVTINRGAEFIRWILIAVVVISAVRFLGIYDFVIGQL
ncbi:MAG: sulfite exporter TauE/SafE family protein [Chloroflexota bacterium]